MIKLSDGILNNRSGVMNLKKKIGIFILCIISIISLSACQSKIQEELENIGIYDGEGLGLQDSKIDLFFYPFSKEEEQLAEEVVAQIIKPKMGEFEKVKVIHDYLVMNVDYDYENYQAQIAETGEIPEESHRAIGALKNKIAVCDGYATAFQLLCKKADVECEIVYGTSKEEAHAWNQVKIDGKWYNVDVTWDDPATLENQVLAFDDHSCNSYEYFCIPDSIMYKDHKAKNAKYVCTAKSLYEKALQAGIPWDDAKYLTSEKELVDLFIEGVDNEESVFSFYIKGSLIGKDAGKFFQKNLAKAGIDFTEGYSWEYRVYFEGTKEPGTFYRYTIRLAAEEEVVRYPVANTYEELKEILLKAYKKGEDSCMVYYDTKAIPWDEKAEKIIYHESGFYTYIDGYYDYEEGNLQLTIFAFY